MTTFYVSQLRVVEVFFVNNTCRGVLWVEKHWSRIDHCFSTDGSRPSIVTGRGRFQMGRGIFSEKSIKFMF